MPEHRDHSKAQPVQGRTGRAHEGARSQMSNVGDDTRGIWGVPEGHGLTPSPDPEDLPAEDQSFSQSGGTSTQPAATKRTGTDESEDQGHFDRSNLQRESKGKPETRKRGERDSGATG